MAMAGVGLGVSVGGLLRIGSKPLVIGLLAAVLLGPVQSTIPGQDHPVAEPASRG